MLKAKPFTPRLVHALQPREELTATSCCEFQYYQRRLWVQIGMILTSFRDHLTEAAKHIAAAPSSEAFADYAKQKGRKRRGNRRADAGAEAPAEAVADAQVVDIF
eukprot:scaffold382496_cov35-Prasinocladus_malaysianus.AAC.1